VPREEMKGCVGGAVQGVIEGVELLSGRKGED
jgi:hypothetical protein